MNRKSRFAFVLLLLSIMSICMVFAVDDLTGKILQTLDTQGIQNISQLDVDEILYSYRGKQYSDELFLKLVQELYDVDGVSYIDINDEIIPESGNIKVTFVFHEIPMIGTIDVEGNSKVKKSDITTAITTVKTGSFIDPEIPSTYQGAVSEITALYLKKGFQTVQVTPSYTLDEETNKVDLVFTVAEGVQQRLVEIAFEGNKFFSSSTLISKISSKTKTLFQAGYLDQDKITADRNTIVGLYQKNGFIDALVTDTRIEVIEPDPEEKPKDYQQMRLVFVIDEGLQWTFNDLTVSGNTVFSDDQIQPLVTLKSGSIADLEVISTILTNISDLYYNDGYIFMTPDVQETRDDQNLTVSYQLNIQENEQSKVDGIVFYGLTKTKEEVFRREVSLKEGAVFSKADLITSYQNIYNTGLLKNLSYNIKGAPNGKDVIVEFTLEEGNQMDIQFGATFGGNVTGFPISGFLQWNDKNVAGLGKNFSVNTTLSPDTQSVELSLGDDWAFGQRWSNTLTLSFSRSIISSGLQLGIGSIRDDGKTYTSDGPYPLGYTSFDAYKAADYAAPNSNYLMKYNMLSFSAGYSTGYTFIYNSGRLALSAGLSLGLNRAIYDHAKYNPFEKLIFQYGEAWQFSNKLTFGLQWDGRDLIYYTTKGYVLSQSFTYAGGALFGLSNYIKSTTSAAGYLKLFGITDKEGVDSNCMLSLTSTLNLMLPQFYKKEGESGWAWHDASEGATKYEMLYIDGMTIGRGFDVITGKSFMWDNMLELSYPLARDVVNAEVFTSATGVYNTLDISSFSSLNWYFAFGAGIKLKIPGFPIGLYLVKNATYNVGSAGSFGWESGNLFWGTKLVLAISTSLI